MKAELSIATTPLPLSDNFLNSTGGLDSFPRFNELPQELRWKIWELALPGLRIVHIYERSLAGNLEEQGLEQNPAPSEEQHSDGDRWKKSTTCGFDSDTEIPAVLLACREAFEYAGYRPSFAYTASWPQTYFHSQKDTLFLSHLTSHLGPTSLDIDDLVRVARDMSNGCELHHVRNLALSIPAYAMYRRGRQRSLLEWLDSILDSFGRVESLTLVLYDESVPGTPLRAKPGPDMVMIDPIDVHRAFRKYDYPSPTNREEGHPLAGTFFAFVRKCLTGSRSGNPSDSQMAPYLEECMERRHRNSKWKVPKIDIKVMLTAVTNDRFEKSKKRYEEVMLLEVDEA
jgi:hypothetical protein